MFPISMTLNIANAAQLAAIQSAIAGGVSSDKPAMVKSNRAAAETPAPKDSGDPAPAAKAPAAAASSPAGTAAALTYDDVRVPFLALSEKEGGRDKCKSILAHFGFEKSIKEAKPEQWPAIIEKVKELSA